MKIAARRSHATLASWMLCAWAALAASASLAAPQNGWWWNPAESGRGFFLEDQGPRMFMAGYFYSDDGRPTWLVSNDLMPDPNAYDARLLAVANGQTLVGDYHAPGVPVDAGPVSLRFTDASHGTLTWAGGTVAIERYAFQHGAPATLQPKTGWWWNPDESGRGFSIELQGDHMFIGAYMYDTDGRPVWYVADALMDSPGVFHGALYHVAGGQTLTGPYRAPAAPTIAGTLAVQFTGTESATVTLTDDGAATKTGKTIVILPQYVLHPVVPPVAEASAKFWVGGFGTKRIFTFDGGVVNEFTVDVPVMTWSQPVDLDTGHYPAFYKVESGFAVVSVKQTAGPCVANGAGSADFSEGDLTVGADGAYQGNVKKSVSVHIVQVCTTSSGTSTTEFDLPNDIDFFMSGTLDAGAMRGTVPDPGIPNTVFSGSWEFTPRF